MVWKTPHLPLSAQGPYLDVIADVFSCYILTSKFGPCTEKIKETAMDVDPYRDSNEAKSAN